jgi:hypothetical protein
MAHQSKPVVTVKKKIFLRTYQLHMESIDNDTTGDKTEWQYIPRGF